MNITELIADLQLHFPASGPKEAADALLAQQVVIEQMRDALGKCIDGFEYTRQYVGYETLPAIEGWSWFDADTAAKKTLALQPDLTALREHDADVCQEFANFLGIEKREDVVKWIVAVRKGE